MKTLITMCILLLCSVANTSCVQYIERYPDGTEKYKYNSCFKEMKGDVKVGETVVEGASGKPQEIEVLTPYGTIKTE